MKYQSLKGMDDLFSPEIERWQVLEEKSRRFFEAYGFREVRTPILESTELFSRSIGEASDIVHKQMYTFSDRGDRSLTLRPEMTASVVRAALEHNLLKDNEPLFVYYMGPMFRAERPQAGRKRQFHQIGLETLNTHSPVNDAELIIMIKEYLESLGLKKFSVKLNHLGSEADRKEFTNELVRYFTKHEAELCDDCKYRLSKNVLRIFDCKVESCRPIILKAPTLQLSEKSASDFNQLLALVQEARVPISIEPKLVRGLDYYTGLVFEVTGEGLGAQDAILAGGRYDSLIHDCGGPKLGASGFSIGVERLLTALQAAGVSLEDFAAQNTVYVAVTAVPLPKVPGSLTQLENEPGTFGRGTDCFFYRTIAQSLVRAGKRAHFSFAKGSLSSHLGRANKLKAGYVLIVGEDEWKAGEVSVKRMDTGTQQRFKLEHLAEELNKI